MMYSDRIMNEFYNPQNFGVIKGAHGVGKVVSDIGSEIIKIFIRYSVFCYRFEVLVLVNMRYLKEFFHLIFCQ